MKRLFLWLIRFYRKNISPLRPPCCRFIPTCSEYTLEAILKHGFFVGVFLGIKRICRCHPWSKGGFDKVPDKKSIVKWVY
jgi:putative membrane protein insertion efficiency factor